MLIAVNLASLILTAIGVLLSIWAICTAKSAKSAATEATARTTAQIRRQTIGAELADLGGAIERTHMLIRSESQDLVALSMSQWLKHSGSVCAHLSGEWVNTQSFTATERSNMAELAGSLRIAATPVVAAVGELAGDVDGPIHGTVRDAYSAMVGTAASIEEMKRVLLFTPVPEGNSK